MECTTAPKERLQWLDVQKGIGIIAVVLGHVLDCRYVYAFHMPLFFIISGYTFHERNNGWLYFKQLCIRLLVPYYSFLILLNILSYIIWKQRIGIHSFFYGGISLKGTYAVFWFINVLFLALLLFNVIIQKKLNLYITTIILISLGYVAQYGKTQWIWNAQVVPMATAYIAIGFILKDIKISYKSIIAKTFSFVIFFCVCMLPHKFPSIALDMKKTDFGIPILSFFISCIITLGIVSISKAIASLRGGGFFAEIGNASMVIMYLHMFVNRLSISCGIDDSVVNVILSLLVPVLCYRMINKHSWSRKVFLGVNRGL